MSQVKNKKVNLPHPPVPKSEKKKKKPIPADNLQDLYSLV